MAYTVVNYRTKKELKEAVSFDDVPVFQPGPFGPDVSPGDVVIEGPHYPEPHRWYARVTVVLRTSFACGAVLVNGVPCWHSTRYVIPRGSKVR